MTFCPSCGAEKKEGSKFCHNCGYAFPDSELGGESVNNSFDSQSNPISNSGVQSSGIPNSGVQTSGIPNSGVEASGIPNPGMQTSENPHTLPKILGYICAILIPLFGVIFAIYMLTRPEEDAKKHGKIMLGLSIFIWIISAILISG